jgi:DUF3102 family protein
MKTNTIMNRAVEINKLHEEFYEGLRTTLQKAIRIGELLVEQKKACEYAEWTPWIKANLTFSPVTARRYMRCFHRRTEIAKRSSEIVFHLDDAARLSATPSKEEIQERTQREKELDERAKAVAKERVAFNEEKKAKTIEVDDFESEPLEEEKEEETDEEFERKVKEHQEAMRRRFEKERSGKAYLQFAESYWEHLSKQYSKEEKRRAAKAVVQVLLDKYPQLMDERI